MDIHYPYYCFIFNYIDPLIHNESEHYYYNLQQNYGILYSY